MTIYNYSIYSIAILYTIGYMYNTVYKPFFKTNKNTEDNLMEKYILLLEIREVRKICDDVKNRGSK